MQKEKLKLKLCYLNTFSTRSPLKQSPNMEADDDFPPELVETTSSGVAEPEEPSEKSVKVPITIVTGIVPHALLRV